MYVLIDLVYKLELHAAMVIGTTLTIRRRRHIHEKLLWLESVL